MNKRQRKKNIKIRNKKLLERYPFLMPYNCWTGKVPDDYDYSYTEYDNIDKGWQIGFGKFFLEDLREACLKTNFLNKLQFIQIKEKFGGLRLYTNAVPQEVQDVLTKYEFISEHICIQCGSPESCVVNNYGWYLPLCKHCWNKGNKKREAKGYEVISWEETVSENKIGLPDEYKIERYSREGNIVTTYNISETTNKIRKKFEKRINKCPD